MNVRIMMVDACIFVTITSVAIIAHAESVMIWTGMVKHVSVSKIPLLSETVVALGQAIKEAIIISSLIPNFLV